MNNKRTILSTLGLVLASLFLLAMDIQVEAECEHIVVTDPAVAATCTTAGKTEGSHCSECNYVFVTPEVIWPLGHTYTTEIKKATPKEDGEVMVKCMNCGEKNEEESYVIYKPEKLLLGSTEYTYTGKAQKFLCDVEDSTGDYLESKNYKVSYKNNKKVGIATVTVTFKGDYYSGKMQETCTIQPKGLTSFTGEGATMYSLKISWKKQAKQTSGYQIQYSTKKNFKKAKTIWVKNVKTTNKEIQGLKEGTKYYFRLRTYKNVKVNGKSKKIYSDWMNTSYATVKYPTLNIHPTTPVKVGSYELYVMYLDENGYPYYYCYGGAEDELQENACRDETTRYMNELKIALGSRYKTRWLRHEWVSENLVRWYWSESSGW